MKRPFLTVLAFGSVMLLARIPAIAQDTQAQTSATQSSQGSTDKDIELLRKDIRSQKKQLIAANVPLTDAEAQAFWPVYDKYTADLVNVNNDKYELIKEYAQGYDTITDAQADDWSTRLLKLDSAVTSLRLQYQPAFRKVLPAKKAALYEQVERKAQLLIDVQVAVAIPIAQP
ncbi:hypothetical protein [Terriglobus sp. TAA 43]|uniref:hypothetical protein n=1 Tax=Terriglobus sp. TAA 43 TaxID=278961 RepID=UPI001E49DEC9|nr:hypothetical protein [Terriglobus sp. TAA 43]